MLGAFWAHPERVLDAEARAGTSGFARMPAEVLARVVEGVRSDLASAEWERRHVTCASADSYDAGLRLLVNLPG